MMKIERVPAEDIQDVGLQPLLAVPGESPEKVTLFPIKNACSNHFTPRRQGEELVKQGKSCPLCWSLGRNEL